MKKVLLSIVSGAVLLLGACSVSSDKEVKELDEKKITVGVTGGPHEQIFEKVKEVAAKDGLEIDIKVFNDYVAPNVSLDEKSLDVNSYQTKSYLDVFKAKLKENQLLTGDFTLMGKTGESKVPEGEYFVNPRYEKKPYSKKNC